MGAGQRSWDGADAAHGHDDAAREALTTDVRRGLARDQKALPPKYFYDRYGSQLFEEITRLPEYYLTRTERRLLHKWMPELVQRYAPRSLLELGAGSGEKTRIILNAMRAQQPAVSYVPLDISAEFLEEATARLRDEFPGLTVAPIVADLADAIVPPRAVTRPMLFAFLGSTIGNFDRNEAIALLRRVRAAMRSGDLFLLGADLHKDAAQIERAYNDEGGVTAEFNRNVLRVLNRELGADFEVESFSHHAPYVADKRRVEMHLVANRDQLVTVPGVGRVRFAAGESIRTEICCKYDREEIVKLLGAADLAIDEWWEDTTDPYALVVAQPAARVARLADAPRAWPGRAVVTRLEQDTREHLFALNCGSADDRRIGAEVEVLLINTTTRSPVSVDRSLEVMRRVAEAEGWSECRSLKATMSEFRTRESGRITFEPGGQIEYSAPPALSLSELARDLQGTVARLSTAFANEGIDCMSLGIDPLTPVEDTTLQLAAERYRRMDHHFANIGKFGARMMRQTAALQICVDAGDDPYSRFALLEAISPYVIAIFANSALYAGAATGHLSYRAHAWRSLDASRTGLVANDAQEPAVAYTRFALGADTILTGSEHEPTQAFGEKLAAGRARVGDWTAHLTTLFPEVRPRGYFELRSCDAVAPQWYFAPLAFVAGLTYDPQSARSAREVLGSSSVGLLASAGRCGLTDPAIGSRVRDLWQLARAGCVALGSAFIDGSDLERVDEFVRQYSARGRSPAHDALESIAL